MNYAGWKPAFEYVYWNYMVNTEYEGKTNDKRWLSLKPVIRVCGVLVFLFTARSGTVLSENRPGNELPRWELPMELSTENTSVTFDIDSTWHLIEGKVKAVKGRVWQENPEDNGTIHALVTMAVSDFDTGNGSRDEKLRTVMHASAHPTVTFEMDHIGGLCTFEELERVASKKCSGSGHGFIEIAGSRRSIILEMTVVRRDSAYLVKGHTSLNWSDFGVEDPSILVAYLNETVNIEVKVKIPMVYRKG